MPSLSNANQEFDKQDSVSDDVPEGSDTVDDTYISRPNDTPAPVVPDETPVEQPYFEDRGDPDSDEALGTSFHINLCPETSSMV